MNQPKKLWNTSIQIEKTLMHQDSPLKTLNETKN